jgi:hypothetical protein
VKKVGCTIALVLQACGFQGNAAKDAENAISDAVADSIPDASQDASVWPCKLGFVNEPGTATTQVGGIGGGNAVNVACGPGQVPVGFRFELSQGATTAGARSMKSMELHCADITATNETTWAYSNPSFRSIGGDGSSMWSPAAFTSPTPTTCDGGSLLSGLQAHGGSSNQVFSNVSIFCRPMPSWQRFGPNVEINIPNSGLATANTYTSTCPDGQLVQSLAVKTGAGLDSVTPYCSQITCR